MSKAISEYHHSLELNHSITTLLLLRPSDCSNATNSSGACVNWGPKAVVMHESETSYNSRSLSKPIDCYLYFCPDTKRDNNAASDDGAVV